MTIRRLVAWMAAFGLVATVTLVVAPASEAQQAGDPITVVETGWWSLRPGTPLPQGAFQVAQNPGGAGDMAIAAVKFRVNAKKLASALFVMGEANSPLNFRNASAGILACVTKSDWTAASANPGLLANAPARDCAKTIQMQRSATLASWSANLLPLLDGKTGLVSVMFAPGAPAPGSLPITSIEDLPIQLPALPVPAVGGVPIPPPLPAPLDYPELPESVAFPADLGFTLEISNVQLSSAAATVDGALSAVGPPIVDSLGGVGDFGFNGAPPLPGASDVTQTSAADVATDLVTPPPALASSSGPGKPWGRAWGLFVLALLIGAAGVFVRKAIAWRAG